MSRRSLLVVAVLLSLAASAPALAQPQKASATVRLRQWTQKKVARVRSRIESKRPAARRALWRASGLARKLVRGRDRRTGTRSALQSSERMQHIARELMEAGATRRELPGMMEHLALGMPSRASAENPDDKILVQRGYITSYNRQRKTPNWVATKLTRSDVTGRFNMRLKFKRNQKLPDEWEPAGPNDYRGAYASARLTRGHLVGSGDQTGDEASHEDTYLMTNQVPQLYDNNAGPWHDFETHLRRSALKEDVYVFAGGIYDHDPPTIGTHEVAVPKATWKVAVVVPRGASFDSPAAKVMYLMVPNEPGKVSLEQTFDQYLVSGQEMERATGMRFFTTQPEVVREKFLASQYRPQVPVHYYSRRKLAEIRKLGLTMPANVQMDPAEQTAGERLARTIGRASSVARPATRFFRPPAPEGER